MEQLTQALEQIFQNISFKVRLKDANVTVEIKIIRFSLRTEKYSGDNILYVMPDFDTETLRDRKAVEKVVESILDKEYRDKFLIGQVIVPHESFWTLLNEQQEAVSSDYNTELYDFILHKLYKRIFRLKHFDEVVRFKVHPYKIVKNTLYIDVRYFSSTREGLQLSHFKKYIESTVLEFLYHLGIRKAGVITDNNPPKVLSEGANPLSFVQFKEYENYVTPIGTISFTITDSENEGGVLRYRVKDVHCKNESDETYMVNDRIQAEIERIVKDDIKRYGFRDAKYGGQANTLIK